MDQLTTLDKIELQKAREEMLIHMFVLDRDDEKFQILLKTFNEYLTTTEQPTLKGFANYLSDKTGDIKIAMRPQMFYGSVIVLNLIQSMLNKDLNEFEVVIKIIQICRLRYNLLKLVVARSPDIFRLLNGAKYIAVISSEPPLTSSNRVAVRIESTNSFFIIHVPFLSKEDFESVVSDLIKCVEKIVTSILTICKRSGFYSKDDIAFVLDEVKSGLNFISEYPPEALLKMGNNIISFGAGSTTMSTPDGSYHFHKKSINIFELDGSTFSSPSECPFFSYGGSLP